MVTSIAITLIVTGYVLAKSELRKWIRSEVVAKAELLEKVTTDVGAKLQRTTTCGDKTCGSVCGYMEVENFASAAEVAALRAISERGMALGGGAGGPTILDLHGGALSYKDKFIDVWSAFNASELPAFKRAEVQVYSDVVERIRSLAERTFSPTRKIHLTAPTFFSRISGDKPPKTLHDEYWHLHVDLEQYGSFVFTSLLYLADGDGKDFEGGQFEFLQPGTQQAVGGDSAGAAGPPVATIGPRRGKLVLFSSGSEHPHRVTRVTSGTRLAITIAFTCDEEAGIEMKDFLGRAEP